MKKIFFIFIAVILLISTNLLAEVLMSEDFETDGNGSRYIVSGASNDGSNDYFVRTDGSFPSGLPNYTSSSNSWYFAAEDMDAEISENVVSLIFDNIDISGATGLTVSGLFAAAEKDKFDSSDYMDVYVDIDNSGSWNLVGSFRNDGADYNTRLGLDSDFNGANEGTFLTSVFTEYSFAINGTGDLIDIKIEIVANSGDEEVAFDNIILSHGETTPTVSIPTFDPVAGTYNDEVVVTITSETAVDTIYYTIDGSTPTNQSNVYSSPLTFTGDTTLKAFATKDGYIDSSISTAVYEVIDTSNIPTGMIISEYIDGSSSNKAVEIYNGTGATVDLAPYSVKLASNGGDWGTTYDMIGTLAAGQVFVIGNSSAVAEIQAVTDATSGITFLNGDDAIGLFYNGVLIDVVGIQGVDPGTGWDVAGVTEATADHTLVRKTTVTVGNTNWAVSAGTNLQNSEWIVHEYDTFDYLGTHGVEPTVGTLFISEVSDAESDINEYIELFNNSDQLLTLENINLLMLRADGSLESTFDLDTYTGDFTILPNNYIIITRGTNRTDFENTAGSLPEGVNFLQGSTAMYFGTSTARRWQLVLITGAKAETIIDDTLEPVGGSGYTSYQSAPGVWVTESSSNNTPGLPTGDQTLPVTLASFMAIQTSDYYAQLTWETHSESGITGYNVFRNESHDVSTAVQVNDRIISANNEATTSTYIFTDTETEINTTYYYWLESNEFDGSSLMHGPIQIRISQNNDTAEIVIPTKTLLRAVYPNPFNPSTTVNFYMDKADDVTINVFNVRGQLINTITRDNFTEGFHNVVWNGKDLDGRDCASGIYFFRMETKTESQMVKGILMK